MKWCMHEHGILPIKQPRSHRPRAIYRKWASMYFYLCMQICLVTVSELCSYEPICPAIWYYSRCSMWSSSQRASGGILLEMPVDDIDFDLFSIRDQHRNRLSLHKTSWNKSIEWTRCAEAIAVCAIPLYSILIVDNLFIAIILFRWREK